MKKFKVGDKVEMTREAVKIFNTCYTTGTVKKVTNYGEVSVKRDYYLGHENTWWDESNWRKIAKNFCC
jgi:hypothetical protein